MALQRSEDWRENEDVHKLRLASRLVNLHQNVDTSSLFLFSLSTQTSEKRGSFFAATTKQKLRGPLIQTLSNKITPHIIIKKIIKANLGSRRAKWTFWSRHSDVEIFGVRGCVAIRRAGVLDTDVGNLLYR